MQKIAFVTGGASGIGAATARLFALQGYFVYIGDVQGDVEQIGIRSTRIRTADRSLVSIPNGKLAELNIETLAARDRMRIGLSLNINPALKPSQLRELHESIIACIKEQPNIIKDTVAPSASQSLLFRSGRASRRSPSDCHAGLERD